MLPFKGFLYDTMLIGYGQGLGPGGRRLPCADFELNYSECLEAYGVIKGKTMCEKLEEDLVECKGAKLRTMRYMIMREERYKKILKGEIPVKERWGDRAPYDSFIQGTFFP